MDAFAHAETLSSLAMISTPCLEDKASVDLRSAHHRGPASKSWAWMFGLVMIKKTGVKTEAESLC